MNALVSLPIVQATASLNRAVIAQRIVALLRERDANRKAMRAADAGFNSPPAPAALTMTYRGPLGPIEIDADPDWLRELLPDFSPRSRRGRRIRRLLRLSEEHHARMWAEREPLASALWSASAIASLANWKQRRKKLAVSEAIASPRLPSRPRLCSRGSSAPTTTASARQGSCWRCLRSPGRHRITDRRKARGGFRAALF